MDRTNHTSIDIAATRAFVFEILADFPRYEEWNPFTVKVDTKGQTGDPIRLNKIRKVAA